MNGKDGELICRFIRTPTEEEACRIIEMYRNQGWWQAYDEGRTDFLHRLIAGSHAFVVAEKGGEIVGMGRAISDGVSDAYIQDITVVPSCRKQGIGERIVLALLERLHADGIAWIGLIAEPGSRGLYQKAGFLEMTGSVPMVLIKES